MPSASASHEAVPAALLVEEGATAAATTTTTLPTLEEASAAVEAPNLMAATIRAAAAAVYIAAASPSSESRARTSGATQTATLKQHQRLLARRHLNLSRRLYPRMSTLEAKIVVRNFYSWLSGVSLEERRLADESVFWEESVASASHP